MAVTNFSRTVFEKQFGKLTEELQERINLFGTPIENITETEIQLEVYPNRPDLLSFHGFARAFKAFLGKETGLRQYIVHPAEKDRIVIVDKSVEKVRPYTVCAIVKNIEFTSEKIKEIVNLQEKIHLTLGRKRKKAAIGIYPASKIKFPIRFTAFEPDKIKFSPLGFKEEMSAFQILKRHPAGQEYSHLLAQKEKYPVFIDSQNNILSMPPIINAENTGRVDEKTADVFVECSGNDLRTLNQCLNIFVTTLADMGGEIYAIEVQSKKKEKTPNLKPEEMKLNTNSIKELLGITIDEKQVKILLERMGYSYNKKKVLVPAWRVDVLHEVDLLEDILIAYGYENLKPEIPAISTIGRRQFKSVIKEKIADILIGKEFLELSNYHLTTKEDAYTKMGLKNKRTGEIENAKTQYNLLREDLTHYILKVLSENVDAEYPQKIFEIGKVFKELGEEENLSIGMAPGNFTECRQVAEYLFAMLDKKIEIVEPVEYPSYFIDGRVALVRIDSKNIGYLGEIHPQILRNWKIKMPAVVLEININEILNIGK